MAIPSNFLPNNAVSLQNTSASAAEIRLGFQSVLDNIVPPSTFVSGSLDEARTKALNAAQIYTNSLPTAPTIPSFPLSTPAFPPKRPSFAEIKNYVETRIESINIKRQQESVTAHKETLKAQENPFTYRQSLKTTKQSTMENVVLGRFNTK
jgi:hypothetical protein